MVRDRGLGRCNMAKGFGSMRWCEGTKGAKSEQSKAMRQDELRSEFWGKTSLFFGVDTKVLNTNDK